MRRLNLCSALKKRDSTHRAYIKFLHLQQKVRIEGGAFSTIELSHGQCKQLALLTTLLEEHLESWCEQTVASCSVKMFDGDHFFLQPLCCKPRGGLVRVLVAILLAPVAQKDTTLATNSRSKNILGVLGGMGPVASAEFVRTIYSYHHGRSEQETPVVMLYSDPTFPDRTEALLSASDHLLLKKLVESLTQLCELGASQIVICCITSHYLLTKLPHHLRSKILSLVDNIFAGLLHTEKRHLLMCTNGTRQSRLFENHPRWQDARELVVLPQQSDQHEVHEIIYRLKANVGVDEILPLVGALLTKYQVDSFIVGCTELHLVTRHMAVASDGVKYKCIDPLTMIAEDLARRNAHATTSWPVTDTVASALS